MSLTGKKWQIYKPEKELSLKLAEETKTSPISSQILINRGLTNPADVDSFINPKLSLLFDPTDIPDMRKATERIKLAKERGEKVAVYGDYDVDGVTGTAILLLTLKKLGIDAIHYIPHRYNEGYGLNVDAISKLKADGIQIILTVDCGISNLTEIEHANSLGMEVIITDHHNPPKVLPKAYAIVNPKLMNIKHKSRELSGAGVAFKFAWGLYRTFGIKDSQDIVSMLDLAGLGTIADIVPLVDENRILAVCGLKSLNDKNRIGLRALINGARVNKKITTDIVNFVISPRLNAAGRLEHANLSVELLTSDDESRVRDLAGQLNKINTKRQGIGEKIKDEVFSRIDTDQLSKAVVLEGDNWNPGVIGIVASKVVDRYYRPTILIGVNNGIGRGSARSIDGFNIYEILDKCRDLFMDFGGHQKAAGFEIEQGNIAEFQRRIKILVDEKLTSEALIPSLLIDVKIDTADINMGLAIELQTLSPFGEGNRTPIFLTQKLRILEKRRVGDGSHLKAKVTDGKNTLDAIGFGMGHLEDKIGFGNEYDIAYNLEVNEFNGFETVQLNLVDMREYNS